MKNFNLFALLASLTLVFSSCSTNETLLPEEQSLDLLKTYTIKRDANGAYSLDYNLNSDAQVENVVDESTNTNNIYLYSSDKQTSRRRSQELTIDGEQLKVGFVDTNSDKQPKITIIDDNIVFAKDTDSNKMLSEYGVTGNEDGTYTLDFIVKNKVTVDFVYNEDEKVYEIHLEEGKTSETSFSRVFEKTNGELLKIYFINHDNKAQARSSIKSDNTGKPAVIIQ
ncbi:hypothetical protein [Polaribacter sp. Hel1_85]|uniref:hypothetical protein n=1 Tax=Polaribacter sp. Hel1_85 TaxID=1250005 RepID=UPI00052B5340|nr:hypothetical protein [Polaribacter sp. Hel1_85]KGL61882.1 hypothetical protein PHEL85_1667 [Polaribacter sp. Hel1_85]